MAAHPGEENVATLFGDVHYFYGPETDNPPHHRFNKGSYVYLFENAHEGRARIEIANRPGTELQDAFDGSLDHTSITYTYRHSCKVSLAVHPDVSQEEWHLPTWDPHNNAIYHYKLHTLDIYFWTPRDAQSFVNGVRRVLPASQLDIQGEPMAQPPPPPPVSHGSADMSHVVQKLEHVALNNGGGRASVAPSTTTATTTTTTNIDAGAVSFAAPPLSAVSATSSQQQQQQQQPAPFAPFAYNPAAPAAPEAIRPREKTPPPEDTVGAVAVHPLHQTLAQDAATPFSPGLVVPAGVGPLSPGVPPPTFHSPPGVPAFPAPPTYTGNPHASAGHPGNTHPGLNRAATMPATGTSLFNSMFLPPPTAASAIPPPLPPTSSASAATALGVSAAGTPTPPSMAPAVQPPPVAHSHSNPGAGTFPSGYSNYNYTNAPSAGVADFSLHQQLYRPTEGEISADYKPKQEPRGKLEDMGGRVEKGVSGMLKKFEKRFG